MNRTFCQQFQPFPALLIIVKNVDVWKPVWWEIVCNYPKYSNRPPSWKIFYTYLAHASAVLPTMNRISTTFVITSNNQKQEKNNSHPKLEKINYFWHFQSHSSDMLCHHLTKPICFQQSILHMKSMDLLWDLIIFPMVVGVVIQWWGGSHRSYGYCPKCSLRKFSSKQNSMLLF